MARSRNRIINLRWPMGGLDLSRAYQNQPPYTTPSALNVRPMGTLEGRARGGTRPGLVKAIEDQLGSGSPVRDIGIVRVVTTDGFTVWTDSFSSDSFESATGTAWTVASWIGTLPSITDETFANVSYATSSVGAVRSTISDLDTAQPYEVSVWVTPYKAAHWGRYKLWARMNTTTPVVTTDGIEARLSITGTTGAYTTTVNLDYYKGGVATNCTTVSLGTSTDAIPSGWFTLLINGTTVQVFWKGTAQYTETITAGGNWGTRVGFGMQCTVADGVCLADSFRLQYYKNAGKETTRSILYAVSNGSLYKQNYRQNMSVVSTGLTLATGHSIRSDEFLQKVYFADYNPVTVSGTDGVASDANTLTAASVANWATAGVVAADMVIVVTAGTGAVVNGTYRIASVSGATLTTTDSMGGAGTCAYRVERAPKIWDPTAATLTVWYASTGQVPCGCPCVARWRDRMVLAGGNAAPHQWAMSRQGDALDWNTAAEATDAARAITGSLAESGRIGEPIRALVVHSDDHLIFGCEYSMWRLLGDPCVGGQIDNISQNIGIIDKNAWCRGPEGQLIFLAHEGIYALQPGSGQFPQSLSRERMPRRLIDVDTTMYEVSLAYDLRDRGVHVKMTNIASNETAGYWFDWLTKGWWPEEYYVTHEPTSMFAYPAETPDDGGVLFGGRDGYIRRHHQRAPNDDGTTFTTYIYIGPFRLGGDEYLGGLVLSLQATLGQYSGSVTWSAMVADTHQEAVSASAFTTGTFTELLNYWQPVGAYGGAAAIKLQGAAGYAWEFEKLLAMVEAAAVQDKR